MTAQEQFPERPQFEALPPWECPDGKQLYVFTKAWPFRSRFGGGVVPEGFITDFASIPGFFRRYLNDDSPIILYPAIRHDLRYKEGKLPRKDADVEIAYDGMEACGARWDQRQAVYAALRIGGAKHYHGK